MLSPQYYPASSNPDPLLTFADDLYSPGVSIWEVWMEEIPFQDVDFDDLEELVGRLKA